MSIAASGDGFTSSEDEGVVGLPPSGVIATAAPDPELTAMIARAAVSIGLEVNRPPSPEPSRLDDWFLGAGRGSQPRPAPVPFFPEVHEELMSSWMAPFTARSHSSASSVLTTLDGGVARGYAGIPQVERAVAVHLCPWNAATWRNRPRLPSKACKLTAALAAKAYSAAGQAASALHAMAILQVHQAKALKQVHEGSTDPGLMQELRTATDFALRATKVTARSLGKAMSTMVVQERHLWLNLAEMKDVDKARFLNAPISQGGLFGDTVEGFAQQFSAVQQQTEAIQHILPWRDAPSTAAPGLGLSLPVAVGALLRPPELLHPRLNRHIGRCVEPLAGERRPPRPSQAPSRPGSRRSGPDAGNPEMLEFALSQETARTAPLLPPVEGREENLLFRFVSYPPSQRKSYFPPGSQVHGTTVCDALPPHSRPRPILPVAKRVRFGDDIPPHAPLASPVRDPGSSKRMPQNAPPSVPSTPTPFRCTTTGTSIVLLEPLAQRLEAWLISLATAPPWCIPLRKDLLSQGLSTIWHPRPDLWNLHVWLLDGTRQTWVVYPRTAPLWQTSAELRAGRHQTPSQDSTISALSQFLPVCWVSKGREELAGVTLAAPFPLTRGYERLFLPQFSSPDGEPWWNPPSTPGSQTGRSSLTPGPVLVLAHPGLRSAPVLG